MKYVPLAWRIPHRHTFLSFRCSRMRDTTNCKRRVMVCIIQHFVWTSGSVVVWRVNEENEQNG